MTTKGLFDQSFKFKNNESVRHKGDTKGNYSSTDLGLLIVNRFLVEDIDDEGNPTYERSYHCRIIQFSQSGNIQHFKERELMSLEEYRENQLKEEQERHDMRERGNKLHQEVFKPSGGLLNADLAIDVLNSKLTYHG